MNEQWGYEYTYALGATLLDVQNVCVSYGSNSILRNVSFQIKDIHRSTRCTGQITAVLAPSGTGKSQLFRVISGLHKPDAGQVLIGADQQPVKAGMVGVVKQNYPLPEYMTVINILMMAAHTKEKDPTKARETVMGHLERFGLTDYRNRYPKQLSGGQQQRVAIIEQIVSNNHLLLMDEPFSGLDINVKRNVQDTIVNVASADELNSIIVTTHDIPAAISIADTIILLGHERDVAGNKIPGATIVYAYNLMDMGLTWHPDIEHLPAFNMLEREIEARFKEL